MTKFIVSVKDVQEAKLAHQSGAQWLDLKYPERGALGALTFEELQDILSDFTEHTGLTWSTTLDELYIEDWINKKQNHQFSIDMKRLHQLGISFVKIGFFTDSLQSALSIIEACSIHTATKKIAVFMADMFWDINLIPLLVKANFSGVMLDTAQKNGLSLRQVIPLPQLTNFVDTAKKNRLICGLSGKLRLDDVPAFLPLKADFLGFRTAVCDNEDRKARLSAAKIEQLFSL